MGMKLEAGRAFSEKFALDESSQAFSGEDEAATARGANVILSRSAARQLGFGAPQSAVGRHMSVGSVPVEVVGVVGDVQFGSLRSETRPTIYRMSSSGQSLMIVRFSHRHPSQVLAAVAQLWRQRVPDMPFDAVFAQDEVLKLYRSDTARSEAFAASSLLAIVIGCLGLYGLAAFTAERRTKEIGIRKVLGARTRDIVRLLVWQFNRPVLLSNLVAWPVAWWLMRGWLNEFSDRISLHPGWFVGAGSLALAIATTTIIGHAVRVARLNPIYALRYE
jgi:putative ABC transport system permease protein